MKSIWKGSISFGLVNIPIQVYPASEEHALEFDLLHKKDLSPIRYARMCKAEGKEIPYSEIVKGYELEKGEYVVVDEEDFKRASAQKTKSIEIQRFILLDEINPIFFEKPYYLEPEKKAGKAYQLLREALNKSKKVALARYVFRSKGHIGVVVAHCDVLLLIQMRYLSEIRSAEDLKIPSEKTSPKELEVALKLIEQLTDKFEPQQYHDTYSEELKRTIEAKLKGKKPVKKTSKALPATHAADLMNLLKESLESSLKDEKREKSAKGTPRAYKTPRKGKGK